MKSDDLKKYADHAMKEGATAAKQIDPSSVVTEGWVRLKCQFGCGGYGHSFCCPPDTPTPEETRLVLNCYTRALLFQIELLPSMEKGKHLKKCFKMLVDLEGEMFKDGYYKAFLYLAGPCRLCKECGKVANRSCNHGDRARPSMEACGIDVFQTARNNGFHIQTLREETEPRNIFCLMLVD